MFALAAAVIGRIVWLAVTEFAAWVIGHDDDAPSRAERIEALERELGIGDEGGPP